MRYSNKNKANSIFNITYIFFSLLCFILGILLAAVLESNPEIQKKECAYEMKIETLIPTRS